MKGEQRFARQSGDDLGQLNPFKNVEKGVSGQERAAGADEQEMEELKKQVKDVEEVLIEQWKYNATPENGDALTFKTPAKPIEEEWKEHQVTHTHTQSRGADIALWAEAHAEPTEQTSQILSKAMMARPKSQLTTCS